MYNNGLSNGNGCAMGDQCCKMKVNGVAANGVCTEDEELLFNKTEYAPYDLSQEPIFPPELKVCMLCHLCRKKNASSQMLLVNGGEERGKYYFLTLSFPVLR
jgi:hypothetical protein